MCDEDWENVCMYGCVQIALRCSLLLECICKNMGMCIFDARKYSLEWNEVRVVADERSYQTASLSYLDENTRTTDEAQGVKYFERVARL